MRRRLYENSRFGNGEDRVWILKHSNGYRKNALNGASMTEYNGILCIRATREVNGEKRVKGFGAYSNVN